MNIFKIMVTLSPPSIRQLCAPNETLNNGLNRNNFYILDFKPALL